MKYILIIAGILLILFIQNGTTKGNVSVNVLVDSSVSWDGSSFEYRDGNPKITIEKIMIPAADKIISLAIHCHTIPLAAYVLKGSVKVLKPSGESKIFNQDEAFIEVMNEWHSGVFTEDTELIVFYAGKVGVPLSIKQANDSPLSKVCQ